jgi:protein-S-isoprenylcysteine O-methyltransferase Ste14
MKSKRSLLILTLLAIVFTVALMFATIELPRALNRFVDAALGIPHFHPAMEPDLIEAFMRSNHVRLIGYSCLAVVVVLILAGFVTERSGLSSLGAIALFLPTFGYFAVYMFFLAGLGILRALWLPFWGDPMKLGDIAYLPYMILVYPSALAGVDVRWLMAFLLIALGLLGFLLGTLAWFYARFRGEGTVDFWLYRFSRHPQYLGWILWSYGLMLMASQVPIPLGGENPGASLPWLISSLIIVCVALAEEIKMGRERGAEYEAYRANTPFLFPIPRFVSLAITAPVRLLLRKDRPENGRELLVIAAIYLVILVILSLPFILLEIPGHIGWGAWPSGLGTIRPWSLRW